MVEKVKLGILDAYVCKNIYIKKKIRLKIEDFYWRLVLINPSFCDSIDNFWL